MQFHARLIGVRPCAIGVLAELPRNHAFHFAIVAIDQLRTGHAGKNLNAQFLGLFGHPTTDIAHGDDVIAMIVHQPRHHDIRQPYPAAFAEHVEIVLPDRHGDGRAFVFPIGDQHIQASGVEHRTREDMRANLGALFQHHHIQIGVELFQTDRSGKPRRTRPHDHHIIFHRLAVYLGHMGPPWLTPASPGPRSLISASAKA